MRQTQHRPADGWANRGMGFESVLNDLHALYRAMGRALIMKQYPPAVIVSHDYRGNLAKVTGRATVDYLGCVNGQFVAFDAKDCEGKRIELSRLEPHQLQDMIDIVRNGGRAFVLVRFERRRCYMIPALAWAAAVRAYKTGKAEAVDGWTPTGKASINETDLPREWAVNDADWLGGFRDGRNHDHG